MQNTAAKRVGHDLTEGPVMNRLLFFAGPIVLANLIQQLYSIVDLMVIGNYVGNVGTVGVATGGEISDFLTPVANAFATAGQIYIAQLAGARRSKELKEAIGTFLTLMFLISFVFLAVSLMFFRQILHALNCPTDAFGQASAYMIITALALPAIFGYNAVCGILRGMGESKRPLLFVIIAATVNIFLDLLLVIVFPLQAAGTAIATAFSEYACFLAAFLYMYKKRESFDFSLKLSYFRLNPQAAIMILKIGIPQAVRSLLVRFSMLWVNANVNAYGLVTSGTNSVGNKIQKFAEIYSSSLAQAGGAMVGQNLGAQKPERAKQTVWCALGSCLVVALLVSALALVVPRQIFGLFTTDADVMEMGVVYLEIMIVHFISSAFTSSFQAMVLGSGNVSLNFAIGILDGVICKIGFSLIFVSFFSMGALSYFWGTAVSRILPGLLCMAYFASGKWKRARLLK